MTTNLLEPRKALNKAFLKIKPSRSHIENFKTHLIAVLDAINEKETEEFHKNLVIDFLKKTYYDPSFSVNTKGRNDLVIHNGKDAKYTVGVIIEAKSPVNKTEMISVENLNGKALQELVLYYLRERITHKNTELKHLVVTNIYEWFVFDAQLFNKLFAENKSFVKQFTDFEEGRLSGKTTDFFYKEIAKPFIETLKGEIVFAHFDIRKYDKPLRNDDKEDDKTLVALYKLLSPEHLLKLSFDNDSNSLDKNFYSELLHIIGLTEVKEGGKKLIERHKQGNRNSGSLLENAIEQLDSLDKISRLQNAKQYGDTKEERLFSIALELTITWVNRILFLKLLEAQLISYHKGDKSYSFLNSELIKDYDNLNSLFFQVLARKPEERNDRVQTDFAKVPYLNSSLFEPTDLEHETLFVSGLEDNATLPLLPATVIKDNQGKKITGSKKALDYFFSFLDAYDFASEGSEDIQEDNKTLINASVLGLIFEKINGYKDGSIFTPGFITMYMSRNTIRRAVVQKFNEINGWNCQSFEELKEDIQQELKTGDRKELRKKANAIINSLKICDPAVGSGHFLVSVLNELIAIKSELNILVDHNLEPLNKYAVEVINDELMVTDEEGIPFSYNPKNKESQRIQETLFHEKQTIIENCLFGVDINPNSVKICRLRLWIELLKNAYYRPLAPEGGVDNLAVSVAIPPSGARGLETLPNIDINIKCGNSLISRFGLDADLKKALKQSKWNIESYKLAVSTYRNAESKEQKREMERLIADIKNNFRSEIAINDPKKLKLEKLKGELINYTQQVGLFERSKKEQTEWNKKVNTLGNEIKTLDTEIEDIKSNKIYENAFEWRFEFPDVLNDEGDFVGFDVIIGNPPYVDIKELKANDVKFYFNNYITASNRINLYSIFVERSFSILNNKSNLSFIIPNSLLMNSSYLDLRKFLEDKIELIIKLPDNIFDEAIVETIIILAKKNSTNENCEIINYGNKEKIIVIDESRKHSLHKKSWKSFDELKFNIFLDNNISNLLLKISNNNKPLVDFADFTLGITPYDKYTGHSKELIENKEFHSKTKLSDEYKPLIKGENIVPYFVSENINQYIKYGKWLGAPREERFFTEPRIIVRQIISGNPPKIYAGYTEQDLYFTQIGFSIIAKNNVENKFLISLFNSKLLNFYHKYMFLDIEKELFQKILIENCKKLPIPHISIENQQPFIDKVNKILSLKSQDPKADTQALEQEIDVMVYELYGLSEEEVRIVEGLN